MWGENLEQQAGAYGFREVDADGQTVTEDAPSPAAEEPGSAGSFAVNPFIIVLWLLAALLVGGGVSAAFNADLTTGPSSGGTPMPFVIFTLAPYAMLGGVIAVVGLLLWHAHQWQHRRSQGHKAGAFSGQQ
jgi:hypothetical protein